MNADRGIETPPHVNDAAQAEDYFSARRNWETYWGGMAEGRGAPQIHDKIRQLRLAIGSLAAKKQDGGPRFAVKSSKELFQKLGQSLSDLNLICYVRDQVVTLIETDTGTACHVKALVRIAAPDGSFLEFVGSGHGMDRDDKAGGKASTYAFKDAVLKALTLPEKDLIDTDDEEGVGADVKPGKRPKSPATVVADPTRREFALDKINAAQSKVELRAIRDSVLVKLPEADQNALSPVYKARMAAVPESAEGN